MRTNTRTNYPLTHQGAPAVIINPEQELRRSVMACMLWEDEFHESGQSIAERLTKLVAELPPDVVAGIAREARNDAHLRHTPLMLAALLAKPKAGKIAGNTISAVVQRADEMAEFLAIYAKVYGVTGDKLKPRLSRQVKRGLGWALCKFDEYELAKYARHEKGQLIKLRDVLNLTHPKPRDQAQADLWKKVLDGKSLAVADTWDNALMQGADKKQTFTRLLTEGKLGYMALLRNLRNMDAAGVDPDLVEKAILARKGAHRVLPFRYVAAARAAPQFEPALDQALVASLQDSPKLEGNTIVLVDVSSSMDSKLSGKSDMTKMLAAATLASMINGNLRVFTFSYTTKEVPPRFGMAGVDAIIHSQAHGGTHLGQAVQVANSIKHDRLIVITDEQTADRVPLPVAEHAYLINVASYRNGVGYGDWVHIDGFSESTLRYIHAYEAQG